MTLYRINIVFLFIGIIGLLSCKKTNKDLNNLNETIIVRHKKADMPAYIHGNASEKVFLIILHGGPGGNGLQYRINTIKSEIEKNNAIVYFDQRGSGNSQGTYANDEVDINVMAEDVLALVDVLKMKYGNDSRFFLLGHSWGGTLGPATLLKDQSNFKGWIDVDGDHSPAGSYEVGRIALQEKANEQIALQNSVEYWQNVLDIANNVSPNFNLDDFFKLNRTAHNAEKQLIKDNVAKPEEIDGGSFFDYNLWQILWNNGKIIDIMKNSGLYSSVSYTNELGNITIPSLVLWGKHDLVVPFVYAQEAFDNLGSSQKEIFIFDQSAHSPMFSEPELFSQKVIEFINTHK